MTSHYYGIENIEEAQQFLKNEYLSNNLITICNALLELDSNNAEEIFGYPDNLKLHSSMTLFAQVENTNPVFNKVIHKYFDGKYDETTLDMIK